MVTSWFNKSLTDILKFLLCHSCDPTYHFKGCLQVCILFLFQLSIAEYQPTLQFSDLKQQFIISHKCLGFWTRLGLQKKGGSSVLQGAGWSPAFDCCIQPRLGWGRRLVCLAPQCSSVRAHSLQLLSHHSVL